MRTRFKSCVVAALAAALLFSSIGVNSAEAHHYRHGRANAAVAGAVIGLFGTIATIAARDADRDRYYYGDPYYDGSSYAYYPPVYRYRHWHYRHHHW